MSKGAIILKIDAGGRVLVPTERQVALVREFERSGLSGPRFAEIAGLKFQTFDDWRRKHGSLRPGRGGAVHLSAEPLPHRRIQASAPGASARTASRASGPPSR